MIITADWHLGLESDSVPSEDGLPSRVVDTATRIQEIIAYANKTKQDVIVAGDVFNSSNPKPYIEAILLSFLVEAKTPIHIIPGNHDCDMQWPSLVAMAAVPLDNVHIYFEPEIIKIEGQDVLFFPHMPRRLRSEKIRQYDGSLYTYLDSLYPMPDIFIGHIQLHQAVPQAGEVESDVMILQEDQEIHTTRYAFLGHIHSHSVYDNVVYPGSIIANTFGEIGNTKGFIEVRPAEQWIFVPFESDVTEYAVVKINLLTKSEIHFSAKKLKRYEGKLLKIVVRTRNRQLVDKQAILNAFNEVARVVRFSVEVQREELEREREEANEDISPTTLLEEYLDERDDVSVTNAKKAMKLAVRLLEEVSSD